METVSVRIRRITDDLKVLQEDLYRAAFDRPEDGSLEQIVDEVLDFKLVADLKSTVDYMRHLLWAYIEVSAKSDSSKIDQALQASRMNRATEMLRLLRNRFGERQSIDPKDASFIEQMSSMVDASLKERDKPKS
jgi:hypothetical protein